MAFLGSCWVKFQVSYCLWLIAVSVLLSSSIVPTTWSNCYFSQRLVHPPTDIFAVWVDGSIFLGCSISIEDLRFLPPLPEVDDVDVSLWDNLSWLVTGSIQDS